MEQQHTTSEPDPGRGPDPDWEAWARTSARAAQAAPPGAPDLAPLLALVDALRRAVPAELQQQLGALVREALLTLRALIDWYLERLDRPQRTVEVEDIPIE